MAPKAAKIQFAKATSAPKKRIADVSAASPPKKKAKVRSMDPKERDRKAVLDALQGAEEIPKACRSMLVAVIACLDEPPAERGALSLMLVDMIGEVIYAHRTTLEKCVAVEEAKYAEVEGSRTFRQMQVQEAEATLGKRIVDVNQKTELLAAASQAIKDAEAAASDAIAKQRDFEVSLSGATDEKAYIEKVLNEHFTPPKLGCDPAEAKHHAEVLVPFAAKCKLNESLVVTLPVFCNKPPSERGPFDQMVIDQFEEQMKNKTAELASLVASSDQHRAEHEAAVEAAKRSSDIATEQRTKAVAELEVAKDSKLDAMIALDQAKTAMSSFEPECQQAADAVTKRKTTLDEFVSQNIASFERLRDQKPPAPSEAEIVEVAPEKEGNLKSACICPRNIEVSNTIEWSSDVPSL